jgi:secretion/DNA translocation related TadE-like protein
VRRPERGSATIDALTLLVVLSTVAMGALTVGAMVVAKHRAGAAADLAALAAAAATLGEPDACAVAADVARRNGAVLTQCARHGRAVDVVVQVAGPTLLGFHPQLTGRARAGPSRAGSSAVPGS